MQNFFVLLKDFSAAVYLFEAFYPCSARDWERSGLLEENPQSGCTEIRASLKGPLWYQVKIRYEASQVWCTQPLFHKVSNHWFSGRNLKG